MWIIHEDVLMRIPDDVPLPAASRRVEVPEEFEADPSAFIVKNGRLVRSRAAAAERKDVLKLTQEEIKILKEAIADGRIGKPKKGESHGKASQ